MADVGTGVNTFIKGINPPKVYVILPLEFELVWYDVAVQHISHYTTGPVPTSHLHSYMDSSI